MLQGGPATVLSKLDIGAFGKQGFHDPCVPFVSRNKQSRYAILGLVVDVRSLGQQVLYDLPVPVLGRYCQSCHTIVPLDVDLRTLG